VRPVNLIPPEDRRGENAPLRAGAVSYAIVGFLGLALVGVVLMVLAGNEISGKEAELAALEVQKAQADVAAANLAEYEQFATLEQSRSDTVSSLAQSRFEWDRVLNELALVIPRRVTLDSLTAAVGGGVAVGEDPATAPSGASAGPTLQIGGCAKGQEGTARFLAALRDIDGVTRVGMQSSALGALDAGGTGGASAAPGGAAAAAGAESADCQTKPQVARFQITVAFDAVPVPLPVTPAPATEVPATETTTSDDGVADASAEQQAATGSADEQVAEAKSGASAVGVGAE